MNLEHSENIKLSSGGLRMFLRGLCCAGETARLM